MKWRSCSSVVGRSVLGEADGVDPGRERARIQAEDVGPRHLGFGRDDLAQARLEEPATGACHARQRIPERHGVFEASLARQSPRSDNAINPLEQSYHAAHGFRRIVPKGIRRSSS